MLKYYSGSYFDLNVYTQNKMDIAPLVTLKDLVGKAKDHSFDKDITNKSKNKEIINKLRKSFDILGDEIAKNVRNNKEPQPNIHEEQMAVNCIFWTAIEDYLVSNENIKTKEFTLIAIGENLIKEYTDLWNKATTDKLKLNYYQEFTYDFYVFFSLLSDIAEIDKGTMVLKERAKYAANKRHAPSKMTKTFALNLYNEENSKYKSKRQTARKISKKVIEYGKGNKFYFIDEHQAIETIYRWILDSKK